MSFFQNYHILLACPAYGGVVHVPFFESVLKLQKICFLNNILLTVFPLSNESLIPRGRNFYCALTLANPNITHLLFIDTDIEFDPDSIIRMLKFDKEIVCGPYPKKHIDLKKVRDIILKNPEIDLDKLESKTLEYVVNLLPLKEGGIIQHTNGFIKCMYAGTGFMLIKRDLLLKMKEKFPELKYTNDVNGYDSPETRDNFYAFFDCFVDPVSKRYLSEDYAFCQRFLEIGGDIWLDILCNLNHIGLRKYSGRYQTIFDVANDEIINK